MGVPAQKITVTKSLKIREIAFPIKEPKPNTVGELVDRLGPLYEKVQKFKLGPLAEYEKLCKELEAAITARPDEQVELPGDKWVAEFSVMSMVREISDMPKVFKLMGREKFLAECKIPLAVIDSELTEAERAEVLTEDRKGSRKKTFRKL